MKTGTKDVGKMQVKTVTAQGVGKQGRLLPRCRLCEEVPVEGLRGGYLISGMFICKACEAIIMRLQIGAPDYEEMMKRIRRLWE